ncbi:MAG TPA: FmdB family zinc ribbon protein [Candidatus Angelobacter sp.]|nr:FmdB family zinc ribbon protein [Candidatus Angelobacter sp.]
MPLYEYQCKKCKHRFEKIQKFSDSPVKKCPECDGPVEQLISAPAVQFKGSGWYVTDYARKGGSTGSIPAASSSDGEGSSSSSAEKSESSDSKSSDSKKEEKTSTKKAEKSEAKSKK